ncbi:unnamed protein product [Blepharisma stoltei]|uniref:Uncharacterized protein n=1 Tax=Blepharisma stoltei TaxID=1481888 RepID=A0AAU9JKI7_9CILI|nr:unnamed protein product [Blepharisma stoltei]
MKRWEEQQLNKIHQKRIQSARPVVNSHAKSQKNFKKAASCYETSLFPLLKQHSLQQYYRKLQELGYEDNLADLLNLTDRELQDLLIQIKTLPGHQSKFREMLSTLESIYSQESTRAASISAPMTTYRLISLGESPLFDSKSPRHNLHIPATDSKRDEIRRLQEELEEALALQAKLEFDLIKTQPPIQLTNKMPVEISRDSFFQTSPSFEECKNPSRLDTNEVGKSMDSMKMRSTIANLDIEEVCKCYARVLESHIKQNLPVINNTMPNSMRSRLLEIFNDEPEEADESSIYNFAKNLMARAQLENEIPIVSLVYLDRFIGKTGIRMNQNTWRRIMFISFVEASKVWDDESFENNSFAVAITKYDVQEINTMESRFLTLLDFEMKISGADYAKAYFMLRTYANEKDRSFPLKALDVEKVLNLQRNANKAEQQAKERYEALYKTL